MDYVKKYSEIYKDIPEKHKKKASELIDKLSEVLDMMDECRKHIVEDGLVVPMCQGNYEIERESPWSKVYDAKAKIMLSILEKLDKMQPEIKADNAVKAGESIVKLVAGGKPVELR